MKVNKKLLTAILESVDEDMFNIFSNKLSEAERDLEDLSHERQLVLEALEEVEQLEQEQTS